MRNSIGTLQITDSQRKELLLWSRSSSFDYRYVVRAKIILLLEKGATYTHIKDTLNVGKTAIAKWKRRFIEQGIAGLQDLSRSGKPRTYTDADHARIIQKACENPQNGYTSWSQRRIAKELESVNPPSIKFSRNTS